MWHRNYVITFTLTNGNHKDSTFVYRLRHHNNLKAYYQFVCLIKMYILYLYDKSYTSNVYIDTACN